MTNELGRRLEERLGEGRDPNLTDVVQRGRRLKNRNRLAAIGTFAVVGVVAWAGVGPLQAAFRDDRVSPAPSVARPGKFDPNALYEDVDEQTRAEIFAFRALADTGLMTLDGRTYNWTYRDDTTETAEHTWQIGFAASECNPSTCAGLSGEDEDGNAATDTFLFVSLSNGEWEVTNIEGNVLNQDVPHIVGYTAPDQREPSHWEFPVVTDKSLDEGSSVQMVALWVGPYPTAAPPSSCEVGGKIIEEGAPDREFERGGWILGMGAIGEVKAPVICEQQISDDQAVPTFGRYTFITGRGFNGEGQPIDNTGIVELDAKKGTACLQSQILGSSSAHLHRGPPPRQHGIVGQQEALVTFFEPPTDYRPTICTRDVDRAALQAIIADPTGVYIEFQNENSGGTIEAPLEPMGEPDETRSESPPWPEGPFAHNCLEENADAEGDFDGDGAPDRMRFEPAYASDGRVDWTIRLERGNGQASVSRVEAECPEVIGAVDIDGDGQDELFYDTGKGMTAALVDLLVFDGELLKNARHVPSDTQLYVGTDTAGSAGIGCFRNQDATGLVEVHLPPDGPVLLTVHLLEGDHLVRSGSTGDGVSNDRLADGEIDCFDLHWQGY